jgi:hypothetical protein
MTSVPNWIAEAVVYHKPYAGIGEVTPIKTWRATGTQIVVTIDGTRGPVERRFSIDTLKRLGGGSHAREHLRASDDPAVLDAVRLRVINDARWKVLAAVDAQRFQDASDDAAATLAKLEAVLTATNKAIASLTEVL